MRKSYVYIAILLIALFFVITGIIYVLRMSFKVHEERLARENETIYETENTVEAASTEEKVSPKASFALKKYYDECSHFEYEEVELPLELVNLTKEEVEEYYPDWEVEEFSENQLVLCKEINGYCNQHFLIKLDDDMVNIYRIGTLGELNSYKTTEISKDYLPEEDIEKLESGIPIFGEGKLAAALEDYE